MPDSSPSPATGTTFPRGFSETDIRYPMVRAGDLVTLNYGKSLVAKHRSPGNIPVYGTNGQCGWHAKALSEGPTVVLGRKGMGPLGVEWCEGPFWVIDTAYYVTSNHPDVDLNYFYYLAKYVGLNHLKDGTSNPSLSRETFYAQLLPIPSFDVQQQIVRVLKTLDGKIELNHRINESLEAISRAAFIDWEREVQGRSSILQISELIDRGALVVGDGYRAKRSELDAEGLPFARAGNLMNGFHFTDAELLGQSGVEAAGEKVSRQLDVALTTKGTVGRIAQVTHSTPSFVYSPQLCYWRVTDYTVLSPHVLFQWMKGPEFQRQLEVVKGQTDMADYASLTDQRRMRMTLPSRQDQDRIDARLEPLASMMESNSAQSETLSGLRDALLPRLLSGQTRTPQDA